MTCRADNGWSVPRIDENDLAVSVAKHRTERVEHDKIELQYLKVHQQFGQGVACPCDQRQQLQRPSTSRGSGSNTQDLPAGQSA